MREMKVTYASLLPGLSKEEFEALKADIKANGQREPAIVDHEGNILDGCHRYKILGAKLRTVVLPGSKRMTDAERKAFVLRANLNRRQLSPTQMQALERQVLQPLANELRWGPDWETKKAKPVRTEAEVGRLLGRPQQTISDWTRKNITTTDASNGCNSRADVKIPKSEHESIWRRWQDGETQQQIADDYHVTQQDVSRICKAVQKAKDEEARIARESQAAAKAVKSLEGVHNGDFRTVAADIPDKSVHLIFTDPPYDRKSLDLYGDLAEIAARILCDGGSLICYLGHYQIDKVLDAIGRHLRLWWVIAVVHTGDSARMREYGIRVKWKPLLWFVKGTRRDKTVFVDDAVISEQDKTKHKWQQSLIEARYYVSKLTKKRDVVFDPFCGSGTTAVACKQLGRRFITCDTDDQALAIARKRIHDTKVL